MRRLFALVAFLLALSLTGPAFAQEASPTAGECVAPELPPGTPTPMEASPAAGMEMEATPEAGPPPADAAPEIPVGEAAPDDVVAEVEAATVNAIYCLNSGDVMAFASLFTPDALME